MNIFLLTFALLMTINPLHNARAQNIDDLELLDTSDAEVLQEVKKRKTEQLSGELELSQLEEIDDLQALKQDIGLFVEEDRKTGEIKKGKIEATPSEQQKEKPSISSDQSLILDNEIKDEIIFDVGAEEKELLKLSQFVAGKIPDNEWNELATKGKEEKYVVQKGDWLWKISQRLFGSGFYYSKIWSLNPHITNPHEIEPGMMLIFDTGDVDTLPSVRLAEGKTADSVVVKGSELREQFDFDSLGEQVEPPWLAERQNLIDQGIYFQYSSPFTYQNLMQEKGQLLSKEYENYNPPETSILVAGSLAEKYDDSGFDKDSKLILDFKEGFYLNSFLTINPVLDFGYIDSSPEGRMMIGVTDKFYIRFDSSLKVKPGDKFSVYIAEGKVAHAVSEREGFRYTITGQLQTIKKINHLWECVLLEALGLVNRGDRITAYTPKINRIIKNFTSRRIEAAFIGAYKDTAGGLSYGDVVYLDRGRLDGVELGNVFNLFAFHDPGTNRRITPDPTYKIGEVTVITLTDNFSTALITSSQINLTLGTLAITKSPEEAAITSKIKRRGTVTGAIQGGKDLLDQLDVDLHLDDVNDDLLNKADQVKLTEDELSELERQEQEKSIIKDHEKDLHQLEQLEAEITSAEKKADELRVDEDKFLEQQTLDTLESEKVKMDADSFESLDEIEKEVGRQYIDEDLNAVENPYGLTEFDLEEIDELLNTSQ